MPNPNNVIVCPKNDHKKGAHPSEQPLDFEYSSIQVDQTMLPVAKGCSIYGLSYNFSRKILSKALNILNPMLKDKIIQRANQLAY